MLWSVSRVPFARSGAGRQNARVPEYAAVARQPIYLRRRCLVEPRTPDAPEQLMAGGCCP